jgi:hypothetical protein
MASKKSSKASKAVSKTVVSTTAVRNTAIPKAVASVAAPAAKAPVEITFDAIAQRAYQIWSNEGGDERSNWLRAEAELRNAA